MSPELQKMMEADRKRQEKEPDTLQGAMERERTLAVQSAEGAFNVTSDTSPDDAGKIISLAERYGMDYSLARDNREEIERKAKEDERRGILAGSPLVANFFRDPARAAVGSDSIEYYGQIAKQFERKAPKRGLLESAAIQAGDIGRSVGAGATQMFGMEASGTGEMLDTAIDLNMRYGLGNIPGVRQAAQAEQDFYADNPEIGRAVRAGLPANILREYGATGKAVAETYRPDQQGIEDQIAEGLGQIIGAVVTGVATGGSTTATTTMFAGMGADQQASRMRALGIDPSDQPAQLFGGAAVTGGTEALRLGSILKVLPASVRNRAINNAFTRIIQQGGEEALQESIEAMAQNYLASAYDPNAKMFDGVTQEAGIAGASAAIFQSLVEIAIPGKQRGANAEAFAERQKALRKTVQEAPVTKRRPKDVRDFIDEASEGATVFLDGNELDALYQADGGFRNIMEDLGLTDADILKAKQGNDVEVPVSRLQTIREEAGAAQEGEDAGSMFDRLVDIARENESAMTPKEARERADTEIIDMEELQRTFSEETEALEGFERAAINVRDQLVNAGRSPEEAEAAGVLWGEFFRTLSAQGVDEGAVFDRLRMRVEGEQGRQTPADAAQTLTQDTRLQDGYQRFQDGDATLDITVTPNGYAEVNMMRVSEEARGQGAASAALGNLIAAADAQGLTLHLTPEAMDGSSLSDTQLRAFYKSRGFVENKGKSKDFTVRSALIRPPQTLEQAGTTNPADTPLTQEEGESSFDFANRQMRDGESIEDAAMAFANMTPAKFQRARDGETLVMDFIDQGMRSVARKREGLSNREIDQHLRAYEAAETDEARIDAAEQLAAATERSARQYPALHDEFYGGGGLYQSAAETNADRLARAKEIGFDTDTPVYKRKKGGFTTDRKKAKKGLFSGPQEYWIRGNSIPFDDFYEQVKANQAADREHQYITKKYGKSSLDPLSVGSWVEPVVQKLRRNGVSHVIHDDGLIQMLELGDIRRTDDPFDPADFDLLEAAAATGYAGGNGRMEALEWLSASDKGLDMSPEARLKRAKDMDFNIEEVLYHGTAQGNAIAADGRMTLGEVSSGGSDQGMAIFLSPRPEVSERYAGLIQTGRYSRRSPSVFPVFVRGDLKEIDWRKAHDTPNFNDVVMAQLIREAKAEGYSGLRIKNMKDDGDAEGTSDQIAIFNPADIRSVTAAFDPDMAGQNNLLYQTDFSALDIDDFSDPANRREFVEIETISEPIGGLPTGSRRYGFKINDKPLVAEFRADQATATYELRITSPEAVGSDRAGMEITEANIEALAHRVHALIERQVQDGAVSVMVAGREEQQFIKEITDRVAQEKGLKSRTFENRVYVGNGTPDTFGQFTGVGALSDFSPRGRPEGQSDRDEFFRRLRSDRGVQRRQDAARKRARRDAEAAGRDTGLLDQNNRASVQIPGVLQDLPGAQILEDSDTIVRLTKAADKTSFLHESAHIFLELYAALESENTAIAERMGEIRKWLKLEPGTPLTREQHEMFAESFEAYLMEGKAPSAELRGVFRQFKAWFTAVYRRMRGRLPDLDPQAKAIFDRMLATEDDIQLARAETTMGLRAAMRDIMSEEQIARYEDFARRAGDVANERLFRKHVEEIRRRDSKAYNQDRQEISAQLRRDYAEEGVYRAKAELTDDGVTIRDGVDPDMIAADYGFTTGDQLVAAVQSAPSLDAIVARETRRKLDALYGDILTDGSAEQEAVEAVFNEGSVKALEVERDALAEKASRDPIPLGDIRAYAQNQIDTLPVSEIIKPGRYAIKARDLHKRSLRTAAKGEWEDALRYTHQAMLQHELARRAYKARDEFETVRRVLKPYRPNRFPKKDTHKKMDPPFIQAIRTLMSLPGADGQFEGMSSLRSFRDKQAAEGIAVQLPAMVETDQPLPEMRNMTMDQVRDFRDSVRQIARQGRANSAEARMAFTEDVKKLADIIRQNYTGDTKRETRNPNRLQRLGSQARAAEALFLRYPFLVESLQGGKDGAIVQALEQGLRRQLTLRNERRSEMGKQLVDILDRHGITQSELNKTISAPAIESGPVKFEQVMALALNMGTQSNRDRLASDPSLGEMAQLETLMDDKLEKRHWDAVQDIWTLIDSLWPEAKAVEQRVSGSTPKKVDAIPVQTRHGTHQGGYFPISYDSSFLSNKDLENADMKDLWAKSVNGMATHAATSKGFLQEREQSVSRPLRLSLDTIVEHIDEVTNDIYMREETIQISRILRHPAFQEALAETHGKEYLKTLETVLKRSVHGSEKSTDLIERLFRTARVNASVAILGLNVRTALLAPISYFQTVLPRYGPKVILDGMMSFYSKGFNARKFIMDKSPFMKERVDTLSREAHERVRNAKGKSVWNKAQGAGYWMMSEVEIWTTSGPTWMGVYRDAIAKGKSEQDAVTDADRAVATTQGSGLEIDQSILQGGAEWQRSLTFLWGYVSGYYGIVRNDIARAKGYQKAWPIAKHLIILNLAASLLEAFLRMKSDGDDEDDPYLQATAEMYWRNIIGMLPGVSLMANRYGGGESPAIAAGQEGFESWRAWERVAADLQESGEIEGDVAYRAARQTAKAIGIAVGFPGTVQIDKAVHTLVTDDDPTAYEIFMSGPDDDN